MEERLVKAARVGDVTTLFNLMEADPEILERACLDHFADSALHVAALYGKPDFVEQIVNLMPSLATETNQKGMIPLHLASSKGNVETVRELLKAKLDDDGVMNQCLVKDDQGWTPLHCASRRGKIKVMEELISACPQCLEQVTAKEETVLHLAVKANQFEAVKLLANRISRHNLHTLFKAPDQNGDKAYELAAAKKQLQVAKILKEDDETKEERGSDIEACEEEEESKGSHDRLQDAILVVATLIITLTYQAIANPPATFLKDGSTRIDWSCLHKGASHGLIKRLKDCPALLALLFMIFDSLVFFQSIVVMLSTLRGQRLLPLIALALNLVFCYCLLLMAFYYKAVYFALPYACFAMALFITSHVYRRKRTRMSQETGIFNIFRILIE